MDTLYEYMLDWSKGSKRRHVDGERSFIERYIRRDEFPTLFSGEALLTDSSGRSEFIGVWGRKAITDLKRTLRERGAEFAMVQAKATDRVLKSYAQHYPKAESVRARNRS
jgi:hypothetical protein